MQWPHGRNMTGVVEVNMYRLQIGQLDSSDRSTHLCFLRLMLMHALQRSQWK